MNVFGLKSTYIRVNRLLSVLPTGLPTQTQTNLLLLWILHLRNLINLKVEIALLGNFNIHLISALSGIGAQGKLFDHSLWHMAFIK